MKVGLGDGAATAFVIVVVVAAVVVGVGVVAAVVAGGGGGGVSSTVAELLGGICCPCPDAVVVSSLLLSGSVSVFTLSLSLFILPSGGSVIVFGGISSGAWFSWCEPIFIHRRREMS